MPVPEYVPAPPDERPRVYGSPPWRPEPWMATRPADLRTRQPVGDRYGWPGPDQGYALRLVHQFADRLVLAEGEERDDVVAGCLGVALKRASLFGRAPVIHDWTIAFTVWGYLDEAPAELVALRRPLFEEVADPHHYEDARVIADLVPESTLRLSPDEVRQRHARDWRSLLRPLDEVLPVAPPAAAAPSADAPAPKKKVVKKVIKKVVKKKAPKATEGEGSVFSRPGEGDRGASGPRRARDLGKDR